MKKEQTTIRLPVELKKQLQQEADNRGESFNGLINLMLYEAYKLIKKGQF